MKITVFIKGFLLFVRPGIYLGFLHGPLQWISNILRLSRWMARQSKTGLNDFYSPLRSYALRYKLYEHVAEKEGLKDHPIDYLEFGVAKANSFKWWVHANQNVNSRFYGFDTFEGLPEEWGRFKKGDMSAGVPEINDPRCKFFKGLFQQTLFPFLDQKELTTDKQKVIHFDADLYSSTLYVLTSLHRYLRPGDILLFDEFNVPNHEFKAFMDYSESYYIQYELLGAVNNYFQIALKLK